MRVNRHKFSFQLKCKSRICKTVSKQRKGRNAATLSLKTPDELVDVTKILDMCNVLC